MTVPWITLDFAPFFRSLEATHWNVFGLKVLPAVAVRGPDTSQELVKGSP